LFAILFFNLPKSLNYASSYAAEFLVFIFYISMNKILSNRTEKALERKREEQLQLVKNEIDDIKLDMEVLSEKDSDMDKMLKGRLHNLIDQKHKLNDKNISKKEKEAQEVEMNLSNFNDDVEKINKDFEKATDKFGSKMMIKQ